jgi:hypothetical protein
MKRIVFICLLSISFFHYSFGIGGSLGNNLTWELDNSGTLHILGTGDIPNLNFYFLGSPYNNIPWYDERNNIRYIVIDSEITSIGNNAFRNCEMLETISIPRSVTRIGKESFLGCSNLENITVNWDEHPPIPETDCFNGVDTKKCILNSIFSNMEAVYRFLPVWKEFNIEDKGCNNVTLPVQINGTTGSLSWYIDICAKTLYIDGTGDMPEYVYNIYSPASNTIPWYPYRNVIKEVVIDGLTSISSNAFRDCDAITSVKLPSTLTRIDECAFMYCGALKSIEIPSGVTIIKDDAFYFCQSLESVNFLGNETNIGRAAFMYCSSLKSPFNIPANISIINSNTFYGCSSLDYINIHDNITEIGVAAFNSSGLTSVHIPSNVQKIGERAFSCCTALQNVIIEEGLTEIEESVFDGCTSLTSVTLPQNSLERIGDNAFSYCSSLPSIIVPDNVTSIGNSAFQGCEMLAAINIPNSVTRIEDFTFQYCISLPTIDLPARVSYIGYGAFRYCTNFSTIDFPKDINTIEANAFLGCTSLTSVIIPDKVTRIKDGTFWHCATLSSVLIPDGVTHIENYAFGNCCTLKNITIPSSVIFIGDNAFGKAEHGDDGGHCITPLKEVTVNWTENFTVPHEDTFWGLIASDCDLRVPKGTAPIYQNLDVWQDFNIVEQDCLPDNRYIKKQENNITWQLDFCEGTLTISGTGDMPDFNDHEEQPWYLYQNIITKVIIKNGITSVGKYAFSHFDVLTEVIIPCSVTRISEEAFSYCPALRAINIPQNVLIEEDVFNNSNVQITRLEPLEVTLTPKHLVCSTATDGTITINVSGGAAPYRYKLEKLTNTTADSCTPYAIISHLDSHTFAELSEGTYRVTVIDYNDCEWSGDEKIESLNLEEIAITQVDVKHQTCFEIHNGSVTVSYTSDTGNPQPVVIELFQDGNATPTVQSNNIFSNLAPGNYKVRVRYEMSLQCINEAKAVREFVIDEIAQLSVSASNPSDPTCLSSPNGSFEMKVEGWADTHTATLSDGTIITPESVNADDVAFFHIKELNGGQYSVLVENECKTELVKSNIINLAVLEPYDLKILEQRENLDCHDSTDGFVKLQISGGDILTGTVLLLNNEDAIINTVNPVSAGVVEFNNLSQGEYEIVYGTTQESCTGDKIKIPITISAPPALPELVIDNITVKHQSCFEVDNGSITVSYSGQDTDYPVVIEVLKNGNVIQTEQSGNTVSGLAPDTYDVRVRYEISPCITAKAIRTMVTVDAISPLSILALNPSDPTCLSSLNGSFEVKVEGWADTHTVKLGEATLTQPTVSNGIATFTVSGLNGGEYSVSVENECGDRKEDSVSLQILEPYNFEIIDEKVYLGCEGDTDGFVKLQITGGHTPSGVIQLLEYKEIIESKDSIDVWGDLIQYNDTIRYKDTIYHGQPIPADSIVLFDKLPKGKYQIVYGTTLEGCTDTKSMKVMDRTIAEGMNFLTDTLHISCLDRRDGEISLLAYQGEWKREIAEVNDDNRSSVMQNNGNERFTYNWRKVDDPAFSFEDRKQTFPLEEFWGDDYATNIYKDVVGVKNLPEGNYICEVTINGGCTYLSDTIPVINPSGLGVLSVNFDEDKANCKIADRRVEIKLRGGWENYAVFFLDEEEKNRALTDIHYIDSLGVIRENDDNFVGEPEYGFEFDDESNEPTVNYNKTDNITTYISAILMPEDNGNKKDHYILIMDNYGCMTDIEQEQYHISIDPVVKLENLNTVNELLCAHDGSGEIQLQATGGVAPYIYSRMYPKDSIVALENNIVKGLQKGFYSFVATESSSDGCEGFNIFEIKDNKDPLILTKLSQKDISCYGGSDGAVLAMMALGTKEENTWLQTDNQLQVTFVRNKEEYTERYIFKMDDNIIEYNPVIGKDSLMFTDIGIGEHTLVIADSNNCESSLEFEITEPAELQVGAITGSEICPDGNGRLTLDDVSGGTKPYKYSLDEENADSYQDDCILKAGTGITGTIPVFVKDAHNCPAKGQGIVRTSTTKLPEPDFLVSTFGYSSDVLAVIDLTPAPTGAVARDSVRFYIDNELIYQEDPRIYTYGTYNKEDESYHEEDRESWLIPEQIGIPGDVKATIVSKAEMDEIKRLWNALKATLPKDEEEWDRTKWTDADLALEKRFKEMKLIDDALEGYTNLYDEDVIKRMSFISLRNDATTAELLEQKEEDDILLPFNITMKVFYNTGCDDEMTKAVALVNDNYDPYPDGHISDRQQDILTLTVIPNPVSRYGDFEIHIEFGNSVDFYISLYDTSGKPIVVNKHFKAEDYAGMKAVIRKEDFGADIQLLGSSVVVVETAAPNRDKAAAVMLVKD